MADDRSTLVLVRFSADRIATLDEWPCAERDTPARPGAVSRLANVGLAYSPRAAAPRDPEKEVFTETAEAGRNFSDLFKAGDDWRPGRASCRGGKAVDHRETGQGRSKAACWPQLRFTP
jgi:hypothetical protein